MAWVKPQHSKTQATQAGKTLVDPTAEPAEHEAAIATINNWRAAHSFPLNTFQVTLRSRARSVEPDPLIAQRLKRLPAIRAKLLRYPSMTLGGMQDVGGCRAVVGNVHRVELLVHAYSTSYTSHELLRYKDYIKEPKTDGYRSYHLIYRYHSDYVDQQAWDGLQIEIQLRSRLQHAWATAVETVDFFTGQALKSSVGQQRWKDFFKLMGSALALRESTALVPGTPQDPQELATLLREASNELKVVSTLRAWGRAIRTLRKHTKGARYFLVSLNPDTRRIRVKGFTEAQAQGAATEYTATEKAIRKRPGAQAVLVGVQSYKALRQAYPSFFVDTELFILALHRATRG